MPLRVLRCNFNTRVADLSPLQGMKLTTLICYQTRVSDLSPLQGLPLEKMAYDVRLYHSADETLLKSLPLKTLNARPVAEFWKQLAARRQAAEEFVESVAKLPAEKQVAAVRARLKELNPNFPNTLGAKVADEQVTTATLFNPQHDLTPLMAFKGLKKLTITGEDNRRLDLSPVNALPLEELTCPEPMARKNASVLAEIKTLKTINGQPAAAFWKSISTGRQGKQAESGPAHPDDQPAVAPKRKQ